ncbi:2TM domain-containing protein [Pseudoalteromonas tunicata]|uniref:2TM domain-containing protein n=2 Tax=Pseudoalteromonas tunicata TaxID=314281 RepID=A4CDM6_9GAMM|nr:2TM domain-containing protein [Pseudoalteromonas tunicata]ATC96442.1 hypothetical protein PTUN_a4245 [Pseudoalteromonas tunicata]EAR27068.1 hypothetical protein PTD2_05340 [Pseudoalteromonas tunicata D2]MDP4982236.1 2TM domain-containing protein [Pseudoalteromonas tunicata]MDP5212341.1 2TM domain-containing protein [Pseudoalteromonas tunicata]
MNHPDSINTVEIIKKVQRLRAFYSHVLQYVVVMLLLSILNFIISPDYIWVIWPALGWGIGIVLQGLSTIGLFAKMAIFDSHWEQKQINKRLASLSQAQTK